MTQFTPPNPQDATVSIITKAIKIYSDNPIHDAIDRIINSCACIDEGDDRHGMASAELHEAANDLVLLVMDLRKKRTDNLRTSINEQKHNQS